MQSKADHAHGREGQLTRVREEQLTEEQLLCRMDELKIRGWKVGDLFYKNNQEKASVEQRSTYKPLEAFYLSLWQVAFMVLRLKLADRLTLLSTKEKEEELARWCKADRGSYEDRKHSFYDPELSKDKTLQEIADIRIALDRNTEVIRHGLKAWGLDETSEFWPVNANEGTTPDDEGSDAAPVASRTTEQEKQNAVPIMFRSPYQRLIASKLILLKLEVDYIKVARCILADNQVLPEVFHKAILENKSNRTLDQLLLKNDDCKTKFMKSVSGVRCVLRERGF